MPQLADNGRPMLVVCGKDPFLNPPSYVVVEKRILSRDKVPFYRGLHTLFQSYFVFKIQYDWDSAPVMEFIQRNLYEINEAGSRLERKVSQKGHKYHSPPEMTPKYTSLFMEFSTWSNSHDATRPE